MSYGKSFDTLPSARLRIAFISRITPKKNLLFLLNALCRVRSSVELSVYGPIRDLSYWSSCKKIAEQLHDNVAFSYKGEIEPDAVPAAFANSHLFVFPTLGENYGHVILESLSASTPVLLSDQTPWKETSLGGISVMRGFDEDQWAARIDRYAQLSRDAWIKCTEDAKAEWRRVLIDPHLYSAYPDMFQSCLAMADD
jgi:glycosyltransferase involved in cell wall biosynthesis